MIRRSLFNIKENVVHEMLVPFLRMIKVLIFTLPSGTQTRIM